MYLRQLSKNLEVLNLAGNAFYSSIDLCTLPQKLRFLYLQRNSLFGSIDLSSLPDSLELIDMSICWLYDETSRSAPPDSETFPGNYYGMYVHKREKKRIDSKPKE